MSEIHLKLHSYKINIMRVRFLIFWLFLVFCSVKAATTPSKNSLNNELIFAGDHIVYKGNKISLGPKAFYIDGQLKNIDSEVFPYVFSSINEAVKHLTNGTEDEPMTLYIAPWVYWIDNPDEPAVREPAVVGGTPFGLEIECNWLRFYGLSDDARDIVLASNRGQTMGAKGNFTMFKITGDGTSSENVTFGNYCNVDLEYPLNPSLNRPKRASAIVQAQLAFCFGDKLVARNTRFISRLNTCPFWGGRRTLFENCHFESTDDAMAPRGVYLNCSFDFYSSKPFGHTEATGAVLLNCDIRSFTRGDQYFVKSRGPVTAIDCRLVSNTADYWGWRAVPEPEEKYYHFNNYFNSAPYFVDKRFLSNSIDLRNKALLNAYRFQFEGKTVYNIYNLLRGNDEWDPMNMKNLVETAEKTLTINLSNIPTQLLISPTRDTVETGKNTLLLKATAKRFGDFTTEVNVNWYLNKSDSAFAAIVPQPDGSCVINSINTTDSVRRVMVFAKSNDGLEAAAQVFAVPEVLAAPVFKQKPALKFDRSGKYILQYVLNGSKIDQSDIKWYRCSDAKGSGAIEVAVSRSNNPNKTYLLNEGDAGWYIMASIRPKNIRSVTGNPVIVISSRPVSREMIHSSVNTFMPDFSTQSFKYQPLFKRGFWTIESYAPADTYDWVADNTRDAWYYGRGEEGAAADTGLVQSVKGARMLFTPVHEKYGDMKVSFTAIPSKTAGQGFSSARQQYMDVYIKFNPQTMTGYALRIIRTTKYGDALDFLLVRYENGKVYPISESVSTDCFRPNCNIELDVKANIFTVRASNPLEYYIQPNRPEVLQKIILRSEIATNIWGGFGFQHTGTTGSGATLIKNLTIEWY